MNTAAHAERPADTVAEIEPNIFAALATMKAPDEVRLQRRTASLLSMVDAFVIATPEDYALAAEELAAVKRFWGSLETERVGYTGPLNQVLDKINGKFQPRLKLAKEVESLWKVKMLAFNDEQERIAAVRAREAERVATLERMRLAAEAAERERVAKVETDRLAAIETERLRVASVAQARIDEEVRQAQAAGNAAAAAALHSQAVALQERNANAAADAADAAAQVTHAAALEVNAIQQQAAVVIAAPQAAPMRVAGLSTAKSWDYETTGLEAAIRDIVLNKPQFISLLMFDSVKMRAQVKALGMSLSIEGVRVFEKSTLRQAGRTGA